MSAFSVLCRPPFQAGARAERGLINPGRLWAIIGIAAVLTGCGQQAEPGASKVRPVRTVTVEKQDLVESITLTGHIRARDEASLAFRIGGRILGRPVNVGDRVQAGQTIANLDALEEQNTLRSAQAAVNSANGIATRARNEFVRQQTLLRQGHTTRVRYDQAEQELLTAESNVKDALAQQQIAQDRLGFTELKADAPGVITVVAAETGEVVQAGRMIVQIARDGGRDAVFDVPANILRAAPGDAEVTVSLADDPTSTVTGRVREVAPQADPVTRNFRVRVGLDSPPAAMRLGSTVTGTALLASAPLMAVPASALTIYDRKPAVWVLEKASSTVAARHVEVKRHEPTSVIISKGLENGDIVVTAGVQALYPGRKVRLLGAPNR